MQRLKCWLQASNEDMAFEELHHLPGSHDMTFSDVFWLQILSNGSTNRVWWSELTTNFHWAAASCAGYFLGDQVSMHSKWMTSVHYSKRRLHREIIFMPPEVFLYTQAKQFCDRRSCQLNRHAHHTAYTRAYTGDITVNCCALSNFRASHPPLSPHLKSLTLVAN